MFPLLLPGQQEPPQGQKTFFPLSKLMPNSPMHSSSLLCVPAIVSCAEVTDDVKPYISTTRSMQHNNSVLSLYVIMLHCLVNVCLECFFGN